MSTFVPHVGNGSSRTRYDLDTNPARVMKTSPCLIDLNAVGVSYIVYLTAQQILVVSGGLWDFIWDSMNAQY